MTQEFIPYTEALSLKELGFNEPCFASIDNFSKMPYIPSKGGTYFNSKDYGKETVACPLYQQAFRWFREKYDLIGLVEGGYDNGKNIFTYVIWDRFKDNSIDVYYQTYEEAELACLIKLIEIVKNK